jgi:hypothetical protein
LNRLRIEPSKRVIHANTSPDSFTAQPWRRLLWIVAGAGVGVGLALSLIGGLIVSWSGWLPALLAYSFLSTLGLVSLLGVCRLIGAHPAAWAALTAFGLRLAIGVLLFLLLPTAGYQESRVTQAGYVFEDAYVRDRQALALARSDDSLSASFTNTYPGDQYGGMLALSAGVYRYLSPDGHRPFLILILGAAAAGLGTLFVWKAAASWFGIRVAGAAAWIFALYPESVLLGSSPMREPYLMMAGAMTFYSLTQIWNGRRSWLLWMAAAALLLLLFQPPAALFAFLVLAGAWLLDPHHKTTWREVVVFGGLLALAVVLVVTVWASLPSLAETGSSSIFLTWLQNNFVFQTYQTERASGMFQKVIRDLGEVWRLPVVLAYGTAQPVLPAALGDKPTVPLIWRTINILRAAGWYTLMLFLVYGLYKTLRGTGSDRRRQLLWLSVITWLWILLAAANAGGDMWDNPRYRTIMLPWLALLAAWAWDWGTSRRDPWLPRLILIECLFVVMFTVWYIGRNYADSFHIGIWHAVALTAAASGVVVLAGILKDRREKG